MPALLLVLAATASLLAGPPPGRLAPPPPGETLPVAFVLTDGAVMIDFAGPWEVFQDVHVPSRGATMEEQMPFRMFTVSDSRDPIRISDGMRVIPDYTFDDAPPAHVVVVPAQSGDSPKMMEWIRRMTRQSDVVMSVCTGAFQLAKAGVLDGKKATTHHGAYSAFRSQFPRVQLQENMRFVQADPVVFTSGGLSSGIDLALHIVDLYFGRPVAEATARQMEYEGTDWRGGGEASVSFSPPAPAVMPHPSDALATGVLGNWEGPLEMGHGALHMALHLWRDQAGRLAGTLDNTDERLLDMALSGATLRGSELHFEVADVEGSFDGALSADSAAITGTWRQHGNVSVPFVLRRVRRSGR